MVALRVGDPFAKARAQSERAFVSAVRNLAAAPVRLAPDCDRAAEHREVRTVLENLAPPVFMLHDALAAEKREPQAQTVLKQWLDALTRAAPARRKKLDAQKAVLTERLPKR